VRKEKEFWTPNQVIDELQSEGYFADSASVDVKADSYWPTELREFVTAFRSELESEIQWTIGGASLALSAFGGVLCYLRSLHLDKDLLSLRKIRKYSTEKTNSSRSCLVLDGKTLVNLEIFENSLDKGRPGTLLDVMEHCV